MKFLGMILGGILSAIGHMIAFMFKNAFIAIRRFTMDPANKNLIWNSQAYSLLFFYVLSFLWLVRKYQDLIYGVGDPVFYRAIPLLMPCFLGHLIYSCPLLFKNVYAKPIIQTFLNALSILAAGQILMRYVPITKGLVISAILFIGVVALTLYYTLHLNIRSTVFNKLTKFVDEQSKQGGVTEIGRMQNGLSKINTNNLDQKGCLSHLRYNSEECKIELFNTIPTKYRQSELMVLNRYDRAQHSQIIGGTGSGKTLLATTLITQDLLNDYIGSTIIEPKGSLINRLSNYLDRTGRAYHRLDPEYEFTDCINPFFVPEGEDIDPMIEANVSAFHGYLGPDSEQYFKSRSTQLLRVGIKALKIVMGNVCTYNDLDRLIQPINDDFRAEILSKLTGRESEVPLLLEYTRNMVGKMQENAMKTYSNLYDYLSELTSNKYIQRIFCGPSTFNIDDSLRNGEIVLVNGAYGTLQTLTYTVGRLYINLMRASTFRRNLKEKIRPHQLTVDEIEMFADEEFSTFLEMAREFEVFVTVIHQGNVQLTDVSERLGVMVKQNAVQKFILAGLDNEDAEYYAEMIGEEYQIGQSSGTDEMSSTGFKTQLKEEKRYRILPSEISRLKGYNPETGEPGECLFRGVHNNVRLDPVIGMIYPLPRRLFEPLTSNNEVVSGESENEEKEVKIRIKVKGNEREEEEEVEEERIFQQQSQDTRGPEKEDLNNDLLQRVKQRGRKAGERREDTEVNEERIQDEEKGKLMRYSAWDKPGENAESLSTTSANSSESDGSKETRRKPQPAVIDQTLTELEEKMARKASGARK